MMRVGMVLLMLMLSLGSVAPVTSADDGVDSMSAWAEEFHAKSLAEEWPEAREALWKLTAKFSQHNWADMDVSVEGIHALSEALVQAKDALTNTQLDAHVVQMHATRLRLGIDALQKRKQPLWHRYYDVLKKDVSELQKQVIAGDKTEVQQALDRLHAHYQLIQPTLYVSRAPQVVEELNALFHFMYKQIHDMAINRQPLQGAVTQWERLLDPLFYGSDEEVLAASDVPEYPVVLSTWLLAILVGTVLTYVIWKKSQAVHIIRR